MLCVRACRRAPPAVCMPKRPRIRSARAGQRPAPRHHQGEGPTAKSGRDSAQARARSTVKCCQNPGQIKSEPRSDRIRTGGQMNRNPHCIRRGARERVCAAGLGCRAPWASSQAQAAPGARDAPHALGGVPRRGPGPGREAKTSISFLLTVGAGSRRRSPSSWRGTRPRAQVMRRSTAGRVVDAPVGTT